MADINQVPRQPSIFDRRQHGTKVNLMKALDIFLVSAYGDENNYYGFVFADPEGHKFNVLLMDNM